MFFHYIHNHFHPVKLIIFQALKNYVLDPNPEYWEGKRGACVGVFQMIIAGREDRYLSIYLFIYISVFQITTLLHYTIRISVKLFILCITPILNLYLFI